MFHLLVTQRPCKVGPSISPLQMRVQSCDVSVDDEVEALDRILSLAVLVLKHAQRHSDVLLFLFKDD